jgi:hypothetical protein
MGEGSDGKRNNNRTIFRSDAALIAEAAADCADKAAYWKARALAAEMSPEAFDRAPKHRYWGAGEPDCPREIKAGNGEIHTLRCKICGLDSPRNPICHADQHFEAQDSPA